MQRQIAIVATIILPFVSAANGTQADDTAITITGQVAGATPFIKKLELNISQVSVLKSVKFKISPKQGSVTRPVSAEFTTEYLEGRGFLNPTTQHITLPVFGLYANSSNTVEVTYFFRDSSSKADTVTMSTTAYADPCGYNNRIVLQERTQSTALSYDFILVKGCRRINSPVIMDTDGEIRWVETARTAHYVCAFVDNSLYITDGPLLYRNELDGAVTLLADYTDQGVTDFHHNMDFSNRGLFLDANTHTNFEAVNLEVDLEGNLLKVWDLSQIISDAMTAGGDDPDQFVVRGQEPSLTDWFHNNAVTYRKADNSVMMSSRENFVICLDYTTGNIKWILGDKTKKWYQFPSLSKYALDVEPGGVPPIGQHALSITYDDKLLLLDNGAASSFQTPRGVTRNYAAGRKYEFHLPAKSVEEVWNYTNDQSIFSPLCSSIYEDSPSNYLVDYSMVNGQTQPSFAQLLGLDAAGNKVFDYRWPTDICRTAYNASPVHLENLYFGGPEVQTTPVWSQVTGANLPAASAKVAVDDAGMSAVTGSFEGTARFTSSIVRTSAGEDDIFVVRYDPTGRLLWARSAGGTGSDVGEDVAIDKDRNIYVVGSFSGSAAFQTSPGLPNTTLTSAGGRDIFLAKYDRNGKLLYARRAGGVGDDVAHGVAVNSKGECAVTGEFSGSATFQGTGSPKTVTGHGERDIFVAKYGPGGSPLFVFTPPDSFGLPGRAAGQAVAFGELDGSASPAYYLYVTGVFPSEPGSAKDMFIIKLSPAGQMVWNRKSVGANYELGTAIATNQVGDSYVTGAFSGTATFSPIVLHASDGTPSLFVAKYDKSGALKFAVTNGGSGATAGAGIALDSLGTPYVTGLFQGISTFGTKTLPVNGSEDTFLAVLAPTTGEFLHAISLAHKAQDLGTGLAIDRFGNILVSGVYGSQSFIYPGRYSALTGSNGFVLKLANKLD